MVAFFVQHVISILKDVVDDGKMTVSARRTYAKDWKNEVEDRVKQWKTARKNQSTCHDQLTFISNVVQYVNVAWKASEHGTVPLKNNFPLFGPCFLPPTYFDIQRRDHNHKDIVPETMYLKPVHIIHPFYYPDLARCPQCHSTNSIGWEGWTGHGHREVHGLHVEETAIGFQLLCKACKANKPASHGRRSKEHQSTWATTSVEFWDKRNFWEIPNGIPYFFKRCAVTRELLDFIVEQRISSTCGGLEENVKQYHLLEYKKRMANYLSAIKQAISTQEKRPSVTGGPTLKVFSAPFDKLGYNDSSITHDLINTVYAEFSTRTVENDSSRYLRTLTARSLSMDHTMKVAGKATMVDANSDRIQIIKALFSVINEHSEILTWRYQRSNVHGEVTEVLNGLRKRHEELNIPFPTTACADNCCQIRRAVLAAFPAIRVVLDVWHFICRYTTTVLDGTRNPHRVQVFSDIRDAILKVPAENGRPAVYWSQEDQAIRLVSVYQKWSEKGGVWSRASAKHVRKGCLSRPADEELNQNDPIAKDGSRMESTHRGWNKMNIGHASGLENMVHLGFDHVLRYNIRRAHSSSVILAKRPFAKSTHGSHYVGFVDSVARQWNMLCDTLKMPLPPLPELEDVQSNEAFGLGPSLSASDYDKLLKVPKIEPKEDSDSEEPEEEILESIQIMRTLSIKPAERFVPEHPTDTPDVIPGIAVKRTPSHTVPAPESSSHNTPTNTPIIDLCSIDELPSRPTTPSLPSQQCSVVGHVPAEAVLEPGHIERAESEAQAAAESLTRQQVRAGKRRATEISNDLKMQFLLDGTREDEQRRKRLRVEHDVGWDSGTEMQLISEAGPDTSQALQSLQSQLNQFGGSTAFSFDVKAAAVTHISQRLRPSGSTPTRGSNTSTTTPAKIHPFFGSLGANPSVPRLSSEPVSSSPAANSTSQATLPVQASNRTIQQLTAQLPPPKGECGPLTRSQRIFKFRTTTDARALAIGGGEFYKHEWFLFMLMRLENGWQSFNMGSSEIVHATEQYNDRLSRENIRRGILSTVPKTPRTVLNKLGEVEDICTKRIKTQNFKSSSGREEFWKRHCDAVPLGRVSEDSKAKGRKGMVCSRCKTLMYPGGRNSELNHAKGHCSDGAPVKFGWQGKLQVKEKDKLPGPLFPLPRGIFMNGESFHPLVFLSTLHDVYDKVFVESHPIKELYLEYDAFIGFLHERTIRISDSGSYLFNIPPFVDIVFPSQISDESRNALIVQHAGHPHLRLDCLRDDLDVQTTGEISQPAASGSSY
ncbi:hypothetical protein EUX98_g7992 [Antrodiella citrinella]|uniref:Uncharacterized protein n=1 Tax=Antrodiella citrinella TaxID=2447956 RepID=A0A4S4MET5_9APHY|nr:hypothetical protein EUX98_g7992 [Antrodiella citrinella]